MSDPCHKCLIEGGWNEEVVKCLSPATHMWRPVEGALVPLCAVHAERLSKLPSIAETITLIDPSSTGENLKGEGE